MQFIYHSDAGCEKIELDGDKFRHIFGSRRAKKEQLFHFRNLKDGILYSYEVLEIGRKSATFTLNSHESCTNSFERKLHIFWCLIDNKSIEKTLPFLNEMSVKEITFVECNRSQKNIKLDFDRMKRILCESSEQCGRDDIIELNVSKTLKEVLKNYKDLVVLDFGGQNDIKDIKEVLIGCEGGFDERERELLKTHRKISFKTDTILRSESAAITIASKLI